MIVLWILLAIVLFLLLVLFSSVHLKVKWNGEPVIKLRFWCFVFDLGKERTPSKPKIKKASGKKKQKPKQEEAASETAPKQKRSLGDFLNLVSFTGNLLKEILKELIMRSKIRLNTLQVVVASEQPDQTAMLYGIVCPALYQFCELVRHFTKSRISYDRVSVVSDFSSTRFQANLDFVLSLRVIDLLMAGRHGLTFLQGFNNFKRGTDYE